MAVIAVTSKKASGKSIGNQDKLAKLALEYSGVSHISCVASAGGYLSNTTDIDSIYTLQTARPHSERKATSQKYKSAAMSKVSGRTKRFLQRLMWVNHNHEFRIISSMSSIHRMLHTTIGDAVAIFCLERAKPSIHPISSWQMSGTLLEHITAKWIHHPLWEIRSRDLLQKKWLIV